MGLGDKLKSVTKEVETRQAEEARQAEQNKLDPIRSQISEWENKEAQVQGLLDELEKEGQQGKVLSADLKAKRGLIHAEMQTNQVALDELGIQNKADIEAHPELSQEPEVLNLKESRQHVHSLNEKRKQTVEQLAALLGDRVHRSLGGLFHRRDVTFAAKHFLLEAAPKLKELRLQTPEGRQVVKKEVQALLSDDIRRGIGNNDHFYGIGAVNKLEKEYPAELVEEAARDEIKDQVMANYAQREKGTELEALTKDFELLNGLPVAVEQARNRLAELRQKGQQLEKHLAELFKDPKDYSQVEDRDSSTRKADSPYRAAQILMRKIQKGEVGEEDRYNAVSEMVDKIDSERRAIPDLVKKNSLTDPEFVSKAIESANLRYDELLQKQSAQDVFNVVERPYSFDLNAQRRSQNLYGQRKVLAVSKHMIELLRNNYGNINEVKRVFEKMRADADKLRDQEIERHIRRFELALLENRLSHFRDENHQALDKVGAYEKKKDQIDKAKLLFAQLKTQLASLLTVRVKIRFEEFSSGFRTYVHLPELEAEQRERTQQIENINGQIETDTAQLREKLKNEPKIFKSGWQASVDTLKVSIKDNQNKVQTLTNEKKSFNDIMEVVRRVDKLLETAQISRTVNGEMTIGEAFSKVEAEYARILQDAPSEQELQLYSREKEMENKRRELEKQVRGY